MINLKENIKWYRKGLVDGIPIGLGYFAVAFTLGIVARKAGLTPFQALLAAGLTNASAGGYAGFTLIGENASYIEMILTQLIVNARYLLMAFALSQKLAPKTTTLHRSLVAFDVTDEIFGISIAVKGDLNPFYNYGAMTVSVPCWAMGTCLGVVMGNALPEVVVSALGVGLYGMFIAIIVPKAAKDKIMAGIILVSMAGSFAFTKISLLDGISEGIRVIILTVVISLGAAILFPVKEEKINE